MPRPCFVHDAAPGYLGLLQHWWRRCSCSSSACCRREPPVSGIAMKPTITGSLSTTCSTDLGFRHGMYVFISPFTVNTTDVYTARTVSEAKADTLTYSTRRVCAPSGLLSSLHRIVVLNCWLSRLSCGREYAPKFALRSYFYLLPSVGAARVSETFLSLFGQGNDKPQASVQNTSGCTLTGSSE